MLTLGRSDPVGAPRVVYRAKKICWQGPRRLLKFGCCSWASSSAGRAPRSQRGGRGFESPLVHQILKDLTDFSEFQNLARLAIWSLRGCLLVAWQRKAGSCFFCPSQAPFALLQEFFVHLGHMRFRVSRPGVLQGCRNFRRL